MNVLLDRINAFPQLGYALPAFAGGDAPVSEGRSDFHAHGSIDTNSGNSAFELCMLLKYVELNGNRSSSIPWSIRQQLLYQNFDANLNRESVVLFRASTAIKKRIQELFHGSSGYQPHWTNFVVLAVSTLTDGWGEYAKFLDLAVWDIVSCPQKSIEAGKLFTRGRTNQPLSRTHLCKASEKRTSRLCKRRKHTKIC